jgi:hypothetical protein
MAGFSAPVQEALGILFADDVMSAAAFGSRIMNQVGTPAIHAAVIRALRRELGAALPNLIWQPGDSTATISFCGMLYSAMPSVLASKVRGLTVSSAIVTSSAADDASTTGRYSISMIAADCWKSFAALFGRAFMPSVSEQLDNVPLAILYQ